MNGKDSGRINAYCFTAYIIVCNMVITISEN